jgi:hypothetical protein
MPRRPPARSPALAPPRLLARRRTTGCAGTVLGAGLAALLLAAPAAAQVESLDRPLAGGALRGNLETALPDDDARRPAARRAAPLDLGPDQSTEAPALERTTPGAAATAASRPNAADAATVPPAPPVTPRRPAVVRNGAVRPVAPTAPTGTGPARPFPATQPDPRDTAAAAREEVEPADDGYEPLGLRLGTFTLLPAIEIAGGRTSNVAGKTDGRGALLWQVAPELVGRSDWSHHALSFELRGTDTVAPSDRDYDRPGFRAALRGRIDLGDETRIDVATGWNRDRQTASKSDDPNSTRIGADLTTRTASLGVTRDVGLVALTLRGDVERADYVGGSTVSGAPLGAEVQDNVRYTAALRGTWGPTAPLRPFVEVRVSKRDWDEALVGGAPRDATGQAAVAGLTADAGPMLRGEIATGWGVDRPDHGPLGSIGGWLLDGTLTWSPDRLTAVKFDAKTSFDPTTNAGSPGAVVRTAAVTVERAVRRDLVASLGTTYSTRGYVGIDRDERDLIVSTGLTWKVNRNLRTFVRGSFEHFTSSVPASDWNAAMVMVGVRIQR